MPEPKWSGPINALRRNEVVREKMSGSTKGSISHWSVPLVMGRCRRERKEGEHRKVAENGRCNLKSGTLVGRRSLLQHSIRETNRVEQNATDMGSSLRRPPNVHRKSGQGVRRGGSIGEDSPFS